MGKYGSGLSALGFGGSKASSSRNRGFRLLGCSGLVLRDRCTQLCTLKLQGRPGQLALMIERRFGGLRRHVQLHSAGFVNEHHKSACHVGNDMPDPSEVAGEAPDETETGP